MKYKLLQLTIIFAQSLQYDTFLIVEIDRCIRANWLAEKHWWHCATLQLFICRKSHLS